jgi:benzil reductase ((S)-benzoin forming)
MKVLITDTGSVFGHGLALEYLNTGAHVYGISKSHNTQLKKFLNYHHLKQDIEIVDELAKNLSIFLGRGKIFDLVVLNADTIPAKQEIKKTTVDQINDAMNVNVLANKVIIDLLLKKFSLIYQVVAISSGALASSARGWNAYAISKSALNTLMRLYAREVPETHFSAIDPGMTSGEDDESKSSPGNKKKHPVSEKLKEVQKKTNIPDPVYAANYMIEAMGTILQEESGVYKDVRDLFFSREVSGQSSQ